MKDHFKKYLRNYTLLIAAVLYNCNFTGFITGKIYKGKLKSFCSPGLNCYSCPGAVLSCPLGSFQGDLAKSAYRLPFYMLGTILLFGILLGRMICGFLCPFGFIQELIHKIPFFKIKKSRATRVLSYLKYFILAVFVILIPIFTLTPGFCKYICPAGTLEAGIPLAILDERIRQSLGFIFAWKVTLLVLCIIVCLTFFRGFCRFICPLGAIYSFFNPVSFFGISVDKDKCTGCNACIKVCKMDTAKVGDRECIHCGHCKDICPEGAIYYRKPWSEREKEKA